MTNIWFAAFDTVPKPLTTNYSMIYVFRSFLDKRVDLLGKIIGSKGTKDDVVKLQNVVVKKKGSSGYLVMGIQFAGKNMRFYIYERGSKDKMKSLNLAQPAL